jgi:DNA-binding NarL/FixJ family response regulator
MGSELTRIAIVEDHPLYRQILGQVIAAAPDLVLVASARAIEELDTTVLDTVDVVLLDLQLPGLSGAAAVAHLCARGRVVLVVSASEARANVVEAIGAGARGYLSKQVEAAEMLTAIRTVSAGHTYVSATLASFLLQSPIRITQREREVLELVADGETDPDIAIALSISVRTVHSHLDRCQRLVRLHVDERQRVGSPAGCRYDHRRCLHLAL